MQECKDSVGDSRKRPLVNTDENGVEDEDFFDFDHQEETRASSALSQKITQLDKEITGRHGMAARLEELEAQMADLVNDLCKVKATNRDLRDQLQLLQSVVIKKDCQIDPLKKELVDQKGRSMRNNLLLHGVAETRGEDCPVIFRDYIGKGTDLTPNQVGSFVIERAHRIGPTRDSKNPRPIVAKLLSFRDKQTILDAWRRKGGPPDVPKTKLKLTNQLPQETLHCRSLNYQLLDNAKASAGGGAELKYRMEGDKLTINNQMIKPPVGKLSAADILEVDSAARRRANLIPKGASRTASERGSTFSAEVFRTTSIAEVRDIYKTSVGCPIKARANHNILAYCVGDTCGWIDDDEHGAGRFLTTWMKRRNLNNTVVMITRQFGGTHLGTRRFELMQQVAKEALDVLSNK